MRLRKKLRIDLCMCLTLLALSCCESPSVKGPRPEIAKDCAECKEIKRLEKMLPVEYANDRYIVIWRFGSIQLASYVSGLIIDKSYIESDRIKKVVYFTFDYPQPNNSHAGKVVTFYNIDVEIQKMNLTDGVKLSELDQIRKNVIVDEGICSNVFIIKQYGSETIYPVNKQIRLSEKTYSLFSQISPSEHLQALSLIHECNNDSIVNRIYRAYQNKDTENYLLEMDPKTND